MTEPTDAQVEAAIAVLREEYELGGYARAADFINGPDDPPPGPERDAALAALRAADEQIEAGVREVVRRALRAAFDA